MNRRAIRIAIVVAIAAAATASLTTPTAATKATEPSSAEVSVRGWARLSYPAPDEVLQFTVDARAENPDDGPPNSASGAARFSHRMGPVDSWAEVAVDCVVVGGPVATITGVVVDASPDNEDLRQTRLGFSVYDGPGNHDRVGFTGPRQPGDPPLWKCVAVAPTFTVMHGGYTVESTS